MSAPIVLNHRGVVSVSGADAAVFLNGLITQSATGLAPGERRWGALLSPQGKVVADFLLERVVGLEPGSESFLLDCAEASCPDLALRLSRFKLRAQVDIAVRDDLCVAAFIGAPDPRSDAAPQRAILSRADAPSGTDLASYHLARIAAGVAEAPFDFAGGDVFPADINMDLLGGVDFRKGCFVGQEVVSRMKRRGTARRRTLTVALSERMVDCPKDIRAGDIEVGVVTSLQEAIAGDRPGAMGLARIRIDRLAEAEAAGAPLQVDGAGVTVIAPHWLADEISALKSARP